jgi:hypothetical protein
MAETSWRNTMRRFVRNVTGSAATAITNVQNAITSRLRRGTAKPTTTVPPQQLSMPLVTNEFANEAPERPVASTSLHQPCSLRAMAGERVLGDNRQSLFDVVDENTAMKNNSIVEKVTSKIPMDEHTFLTKAKLTLCNLLEQHRNTKIKFNLTCIMIRTAMATGEQHDDKPTFWSEAHENFPATELNDLYEIMKEKVLYAFASHLNKGSNWRFKEVKSLTVHNDRNIPLRGSSYKDLPKFVKDKKAVINIKNADNECFR